MNFGDKVKIILKTGEFEGILMPEDKVGYLDLKLSSGYNIGIDKKKVKEIKVLEKAKSNKISIKDVKVDSKKKTISILHCGGTVASKVDYETGGVTAKFSPSELINLFPELKEIANIDSKLVAQMMSENMRFAHYNIIAKAVEKEVKKGVDGIIITHGTDTLHYTSAALAFILEGLNLPVIIVGSQRSSDRGSSDAAMNLTCAAEFIVNTDFAGVGVCMHEKTDDNNCVIMPATKIRKMHTSRRNAFLPINTSAYARVNFETKKIDLISNFSGKISDAKLKLKLFKEDLKVGLLKAHTNMYAEEFTVYKGFDGLVVEGTGLGQLPNSVVDDYTKESAKILKVIKELTTKIPVVMASQCISGRVNMNVYSEGRTNIALGILGNLHDMTPETTFVKLAWLLSNGIDVKENISENLRGEITDRTEENTFLN